MAKYVIDSSTLTDIANAIREENTWIFDEIPTEQMSTEIRNLQNGHLDIGQNGTYNVKGMGSVDVAVPSYPEPTGTTTITENGTYNVKDFAEALVNVSGGGESLMDVDTWELMSTWTCPKGQWVNLCDEIGFPVCDPDTYVMQMVSPTGFAGTMAVRNVARLVSTTPLWVEKTRELWVGDIQNWYGQDNSYCGLHNGSSGGLRGGFATPLRMIEDYGLYRSPAFSLSNFTSLDLSGSSAYSITDAYGQTWLGIGATRSDTDVPIFLNSEYTIINFKFPFRS